MAIDHEFAVSEAEIILMLGFQGYYGGPESEKPLMDAKINGMREILSCFIGDEETYKVAKRAEEMAKGLLEIE